MVKENKVKVEAEITTRKNVFSGIGKGFGITIGIVLALILIMASCGILVSNYFKKVEEKPNEITANIIKESYQTGQKSQQQVQTQEQIKTIIEESKK